MSPRSIVWGALVLSAFAGLAVAAKASELLAARRARKPVAAKPLNVAALLEAIADVESGNDPHAVGALGELGRCQFRASTWSEYTNAPFAVYARTDCELTRKIERTHLARLCAQLLRHGHQLEPALLAAAWRAGAGNAVRFVRSDPARRVANLYFDRPDRPARPLPR